MSEQIKVGDLVWLPTPIRDHPDSSSMYAQALAFEDRNAAEPGRVVWLDSSGWVMVDRGSWGLFGHHISTLRRADQIAAPATAEEVP